MDSPRDQPWLAAVEAEGFAGLAGPVRLELDETRTVLVGKNGSGKSLVMEALAFAAKAARFRQPVSQAVRFRCEIARPRTSSLAYQYRLQLVERVERGLVETIEEWEERCWELEGADLWNIRNSQLVLRGGEPRPFLPGASLLYVGDKYYPEVATEAGLIHQMLAGIHLVQSGIPRRGEVGPRQEILLPTLVPARSTQSAPTLPYGRLADMARWITLQREHDEPRFEELVEILRSLGVVQDVVVETYTGTSSTSRDFSAVLFDGVNLGFQADGTLRVVEIVVQLLQKGITCLLVEEPELAVHPGLLGKLLALMTSYSLDRQIVVTTHSPQVVDWAAPPQLRLVEREGEVTRIRRIDDAQLSLLTQYLQDQGTLADFLYGHESR